MMNGVSDALLERIRSRASGEMDVRHTLVLAGEVDGATDAMRQEAQAAWREAVVEAYVAEVRAAKISALPDE